MIRTPQAWTTTLGSSDVTIGVIDSGVDTDHPDLQDRFGDDPGHDYFDEDDDPSEEGIRLLYEYDHGEQDWDLTYESHGTAVTGVAAATIDNGTGVAGISNSSVMSARISGGADILGGGTIGGLSDMIDIGHIERAIREFVDNGVDILNLSLSVHRSAISESAVERIREMVSYADDNGVLLVTGSGNQGTRYSDPEGREENGLTDAPKVNLPGTIDEVLCVGGVTNPAKNNDPGWWSDSPTEWDLSLWAPGDGRKSQYGPSVDVVAPAQKVLTTWPSERNHWFLRDDPYDTAGATSIATPHVTGVAALALAANPDLSPAALRELIPSSARDLGDELSEEEQGNGLVDAANTVQRASEF
jgi:serine protease